MRKVYIVFYPILFSMALSQNILSPQQRLSYFISAINSSGANGTLEFIDYGLGNTLIVINMTGLQSQRIYPAHIHAGNCESNGDVIVPLESVGGDSGLSITLATATFDSLIAGDYYLNVHESPENLATVIACGEVGATAEPLATAKLTPTDISTEAAPGTVEQTGVAQGSTLPTGVKPEEFATSMRTEGYGIFAVSGSNVYGQIQVAEEADGTARVIVTLNNIQRGERYPLEIFQGDCGPDRPLLIRLNDVPSVPADPTASTTYTTLSYDQIAKNNNFVYVYGPDGRVLACGEVGLGANY
jgi:hypothetical protein